MSEEKTDKPKPKATPIVKKKRRFAIDEGEHYSGNIKFQIDASYELTDDLSDIVHKKLLMDEIKSVIDLSEYRHYNDSDENGNIIKLNKIQINQVYGYILGNLPVGYSKIEIWEGIAEFFDIYPNKFFSSLSNIYKHDLMQELNKKIDIFDKFGVGKIF